MISNVDIWLYGAVGGEELHNGPRLLRQRFTAVARWEQQHARLGSRLFLTSAAFTRANVSPEWNALMSPQQMDVGFNAHLLSLVSWMLTCYDSLPIFAVRCPDVGVCVCFFFYACCHEFRPD